MTAGPATRAAAVGAGPALLPTVAALVDVNTVWPDDPVELRFGGRRIAHRPHGGRSSCRVLVLGPGVSLWAGGFRRGAVGRIGAAPGCVLLVTGIPVGHRDLAQPGVVVRPGVTRAVTVYDRFGRERVERLIEVWCARLQDDPVLAGYVRRVGTPDALRAHLHYLLLIALDGPQPYDRRRYLRWQWRRRYEPLGLTVSDVDRLVRHLVFALRSVRVEEPLARHLLGLVRTWRRWYRLATQGQ